jgi:hypothetical protein
MYLKIVILGWSTGYGFESGSSGEPRVCAGNGENSPEPVQGTHGAQQTDSGLWYQPQYFCSPFY